MFGIRTYGNLIRRAIEFQDPALLGATMLFYSFVLVVGNLLADIALAAVDPRIRYD
jgi:ABC-type dipeptide/oligopeptide/nickel transport system permease component